MMGSGRQGSVQRLGGAATDVLSGLSVDAVADLRTRFRGDVLTASDHEYDAARMIWNAMIDKRPSLIARCAGVADVIEAVKFAREHDLLIAIRGGGHSAAGLALCDEGMVIDMTRMKGARVDPIARTVLAQAGMLGPTSTWRPRRSASQ